jgi:hypothetical protein
LAKIEGSMAKPINVILPELSRIFDKAEAEEEGDVFDKSLRQWLAHCMMLNRAMRWQRILNSRPHTMVELPKSREILITFWVVPNHT